MNIRNNITNYLFDKEYIICTYENYVYVYKFIYLDSFSDTRIILKLEKKSIIIKGNNLTIIKIIDEEILIKGRILAIELGDNK